MQLVSILISNLIVVGWRNAKLNVAMWNVFLTVVNSRHFHHMTAYRRIRPIATNHQISILRHRLARWPAH